MRAWVACGVLAALAMPACACRVPSKGRAEGGKYRRCATPGRSGQGSVTAGKVTCSWDDDRAACAPDPGDSLDLCVLAGAAAGDATAANVDAFVRTCKAGGVDMMVALGDTGSSEQEIRALAGRLASAGVMVGLLPGSSEHYREFLDAVDAARADGEPVIDLSRVRTIAWGSVTLVTLPGLRDPYYLASGSEGCGYGDGDVEHLGTLLDGIDGQAVLLSVEPPRGDGQWGVDRSRAGTHVGDPALAQALAGRDGLFGVFGHVYESAGVAVDPRTGASLAQGVGHPGLWVNTGSIEAAPWEGEGGGLFSTGQAVVLQIAPGAARYFVWQAGAQGEP